MKRSPIIIMTLALVIAALSSGVATAAGSATWTIHESATFRVYRCAWTSDASGNVSAGTGVGSIAITGTLVGVNFKSDHNSVPTNLYDVQMLTEGGENIIYSAGDATNVGADVPSAINSTDQRRTPFDKDGVYKKIFGETVTPSISNAGGSKSGFVEMIVKP